MIQRSLCIFACMSAAACCMPAVGLASSPLTFGHPVNFKPLPGLPDGPAASCPTARLCVAAAGTTGVDVTSDPTGGPRAWSLSTIASGGFISGLSCPSPTLCVAVGQEENRSGIYVTTDPAGGPAAWSFGGLDYGSLFTGVACPSTTLCVAIDVTGQILTSADPLAGPAGWTSGTIDKGQDIVGVSCPSARLCVAADLRGAIFASTDPSAGADTWHRTRRPGKGRLLSEISCPTTHFCVAVGDGIVTSVDPTGGNRAWHRIPEPHVNTQSRGLTGIACRSRHLCVAADETGLVFVSTHPTGGVGAWHVRRIHRLPRVFADTQVSFAHSRSPLCLVVDQRGWIVAGRAPRRRHRRRR